MQTCKGFRWIMNPSCEKVSLPRTIPSLEESTQGILRCDRRIFRNGSCRASSNWWLTETLSPSFLLANACCIQRKHTTTKAQAVFDTSAKSSTGVSFNDTLMVGPTVHPLIDVLMRFRQHRIALTADISKMYRAIEMVTNDRDFHRFVWRKDPNDT